MESALRTLQDERRLWEFTRDQEREDELPETLLEQVTQVVEILRGGEDVARSARDAVLALQAGVAQQQSALDEILVRQQEGIAERSVGIFEADSPPLWRAFDAVGTEEMGVIEQIGALAQRQLQDLRGYIAERGTILLTWVLLWIGLAVTLILMRSKARLWVQHDRSLETTVAMLDRPMTAAAVIILAVANLFDQQAPTAWFDLVNLLLLLTLLLLLFGILAKALRPLAYLLIALFVLMRLVQLSPVASVTQRLAMLALSLAGITCCWWLLRSLRKNPDEVPEAWRRWVARGLRSPDPELGLEDCRRVIRLGRLLRQEDTVIISDLVGLACIRMGTQGIYEIAVREGDAKLALLAGWVALTLLLFAVSGGGVLSTSRAVTEEPFRNFFVGLTGVVAMLLTALLLSAVTGAFLAVPLLVLVAVVALVLRGAVNRRDRVSREKQLGGAAAAEGGLLRSGSYRYANAAPENSFRNGAPVANAVPLDDTVG